MTGETVADGGMTVNIQGRAIEGEDAVEIIRIGDEQRGGQTVGQHSGVLIHWSRHRRAAVLRCDSARCGGLASSSEIMGRREFHVMSAHGTCYGVVRRV